MGGRDGSRSASREWVTIHRALRAVSPGPPREGSEMEQVLHLRGADIRVRWLLVECRAPTLARWEGHGPARSQALIEYRLDRRAGGHAVRLSRTSSSRRSAPSARSPAAR